MTDERRTPNEQVEKQRFAEAKMEDVEVHVPRSTSNNSWSEAPYTSMETNSGARVADSDAREAKHVHTAERKSRDGGAISKRQHNRTSSFDGSSHHHCRACDDHLSSNEVDIHYASDKHRLQAFISAHTHTVRFFCTNCSGFWSIEQRSGRAHCCRSSVNRVVPCDICGEQFASLDAWIDHLVTSTRHQNFVRSYPSVSCTSCSMRFLQPHHRLHMERAHKRRSSNVRRSSRKVRKRSKYIDVIEVQKFDADSEGSNCNEADGTAERKDGIKNREASFDEETEDNLDEPNNMNSEKQAEIRDYERVSHGVSFSNNQARNHGSNSLNSQDVKEKHLGDSVRGKIEQVVENRYSYGLEKAEENPVDIPRYESDAIGFENVTVKQEPVLVDKPKNPEGTSLEHVNESWKESTTSGVVKMENEIVNPISGILVNPSENLAGKVDFSTSAPGTLHDISRNGKSMDLNATARDGTSERCNERDNLPLLDRSLQQAAEVLHIQSEEDEDENSESEEPSKDLTIKDPRKELSRRAELSVLLKEAKEHAALEARETKLLTFRRCAICRVQVSTESWPRHTYSVYHKKNMVREFRRPLAPGYEHCRHCCTVIPKNGISGHNCERPKNSPFYLCKVCNVKVLMTEAYTHLGSKSHALKVVAAQTEVHCDDCEENVPASEWDGPCGIRSGHRAAVPPSVRCEVCAVNVSCVKHFARHIESAEHAHFLSEYPKLGVNLMKCATCGLNILPSHVPFHRHEERTQVVDVTKHEGKTQIEDFSEDEGESEMEDLTDHEGEAEMEDFIEHKRETQIVNTTPPASPEKPKKPRFRKAEKFSVTLYSSSPQLHCELCNIRSTRKSFPDHLLGKKHMSNALVNPTIVKCLACDENISLEDWQEHQRKHEQPNCVVRCNLCYLNFSSISKWAQHLTEDNHRHFISAFKGKKQEKLKRLTNLLDCTHCKRSFLPQNLDAHIHYVCGKTNSKGTNGLVDKPAETSATVCDKIIDASQPANQSTEDPVLSTEIQPHETDLSNEPNIQNADARMTDELQNLNVDDEEGSDLESLRGLSPPREFCNIQPLPPGIATNVREEDGAALMLDARASVTHETSEALHCVSEARRTDGCDVESTIPMKRQREKYGQDVADTDECSIHENNQNSAKRLRTEKSEDLMNEPHESESITPVKRQREDFERDPVDRDELAIHRNVQNNAKRSRTEKSEDIMHS